MIEFRYLQTGIHGLANAHRAGTMAGHLGAAVVAGYFFGEEQSELPDEVFRGIEGEIQRVIAGEEAIWWNVKQAGIAPVDLFQPLPQEAPEPDAISNIAEALLRNVGALRQSGHNLIFASIAIRALHEHTDLATPRVVAGLVKLIEGFNSAPAGRGYYGKQRGWLNANQVELASDTTLRPDVSIEAMVDSTVNELIASAAVKKQGFGGLWHVINHAAAITEMARFGYQSLAHRALPAHYRHLQLWRSLPDVQEELGPVTKAADDPREPAYWQGMLKRDEARLTHRIKTLYGYHTLRRFIGSAAQRDRADDALRYLMA